MSITKSEMTWSEELDCFLCLAIEMANTKLEETTRLNDKIPYNQLREDLKQAKAIMRRMAYQLDDYSTTGAFELPVKAK